MRKFAMNRIGIPLVLAFTMTAAATVDAATVTYTMQTGNFNSLQTQNNNNAPYAGTYNNGGTELAQYANGGWFGTTPGAAAFQTFTTTGNGSTGSARALQVGDTFTITGYTSANPSSGGYLGISFRDSTTYTNFSSATDGSTEARFQLDNSGGWKVYNSGSAIDSSLGSNADRTFTIKITSSTTFDATIGGNTYYNLGMAASGGTIDSFAIYTLGDSNQNSFWKNASLSDSGTVELGYAAANGTTVTPGLVSDGLAADSTSTARSNAVNIGGSAGSQVNLNQNNTYTGATTINANATAEAQHANALGTTAAGTTVTNNGALKLYNATGISFASEALTLNGLGVSGANGALRSVGGNNTWNGNITLASSSRINADTTGGAGSLTIAGTVSGSSNVLFLGANGANISVSGAISGAGATQDGTTTSLFKDGANTLTLSGNNTYTGDTRVNAGTLTVASGGNLGNGTSDVFISSGATLNINTSTTVASVQETGNLNGGVIAIGSGATLSVNGANKGTLYQNSISGSGGLTVNGSGNTSLSLYGTQSYSGATTVSGAKLSTGVALATSGLTINGGTFETTAANILGNSASVSLSSGTYSLGGNDTIGSLTMSGGSLSGTSTLTASTYALNGGSVGANLGAGSLSVGGSTTLNGTSAASSVSLTAGTLTLGGNNRLSTSASVSLGAGTTLGLGANSQQLAALTGSGAVTTTSSGSLNLNIASGSNTFGGAISGGGGLTKSGNGTLFLTGTNTFTGTTDVTSGIVRVNGSIAGDATVSSGATLGGTGTISGSVNVTGVLSPGASIESLAVGTTSFSHGSTFEWEYNSQDVAADLLAINGDLNLSGTVSLDIIDLASIGQLLANDTKFTLISYTGSWNNRAFDGYADDSTFSFGGNEWVINYNDVTGGSNFTADQSGAFGFVTMTVVPEPSSFAMALIAGGLLATRRRRTA
jgi:autotransporter-associated beta strand protein